MLRKGGTLIRDYVDVLEMIGEGNTSQIQELPLFGEPTAPDGLVDSLEPLLRRVYEALPQRRSMTTERLAVAAGLDEESVKVALARLQLSAFVAVDERGWHRSLGQAR